MKGHPESNCGSVGGGNGWMKKRKVAMIAVVILVGVMGVMVVQKVRDRRLYNLVIKDKDRQILSLHLLLQKERQYSMETKRKNQDLNAKLYSLRTQKFELDNKLMEMRSTIGSMKDEQRALELAIDEKQNEIKHKESEVKDFRSNLQTPPKIWSVSSDDPSNHEVNSTIKISSTNFSSWFGQSSNRHKPNQKSGVKGNKEDAKIEIYNTTDKVDSDTNDHGLSFKGRRSFTGASESQRVKEEHAIGSITQADSQTEEGRPKANREEDPTEITRFVSEKRSIGQETKMKADRIYEDEAEVDKKSSMESSSGSEADQDYKEETED